MTKYYGWIPNVAGRLSYSIAGHTNYPSRVVFKGDLEDSGELFVGFQRRNLSDTSLPFLSEWVPLRRIVDKWFYQKSGDFVFVCAMKHWQEDDCLKGMVFIFDNETWRNTARSHVQMLLEKFTNHSEMEPLKIGKYIEENTGAVAKASARFSVSRKGECEIEPERLPDDPEKRFHDLEQAIASQTYFFVRDMLHTHKFHSPSTDRILDVHSSAEWRSLVNFALARKSIRLRRDGRPADLHRALGIVSYLESFRLNLMSSDERDALPFSLANFTESVKNYLPLAIAQDDRKPSRRIQRYADRLIFFVTTIFALAVAVGRIAPENKTRPELVRDSVNFLNDYLLEVGVAIVVVAAFVRTIVPDQIRIREKISRNLSRHAVCYGRRRYGTAEILIGVILITLGARMIAHIFS